MLGRQLQPVPRGVRVETGGRQLDHTPTVALQLVQALLEQRVRDDGDSCVSAGRRSRAREGGRRDAPAPQPGRSPGPVADPVRRGIGRPRARAPPELLEKIRRREGALSCRRRCSAHRPIRVPTGSKSTPIVGSSPRRSAPRRHQPRHVAPSSPPRLAIRRQCLAEERVSACSRTTRNAWRRRTRASGTASDGSSSRARQNIDHGFPHAGALAPPVLSRSDRAGSVR